MHKERRLAAILLAAAGLLLTACGREAKKTPAGGAENGVAAIEGVMTTPSENHIAISASIDDLRSGSSADTVATPSDFPSEHQFLNKGVHKQ